MEAEIHDDKENSTKLEKILRSNVFRRAEKQRKMLEHLAKKTMAEAWDDLHQDAILREVFNKTDKVSVVGTTASRIRASLKKYYEREGQDDSVILRLRPGSYRIIAEARGTSPAFLVS